MTKEGFWNELKEKYPQQMIHFGAWIDQYKKAVNWNSLFGSHTTKIQGRVVCIATAPKYHDLPIAMQVGIFIQYCLETPNTGCLIDGLPSNMNRFAELIKTWFAGEHVAISKSIYPTPPEVVQKLIKP